MPIVIVVVLLILSAVLKSEIWRKRSFYLGLGMLIFFSNSFMANEAMRMWSISPVPFEDVEQREVGVVLGGVVLGDTKLDDRAFLDKGGDRIYHTNILYKKGLIKKIFISGGTGRLIDIGQREAEQIADALVLMGVDRNDIEFEARSRNTHENAVFTVEWLNDRYKPGDCLLITSTYHMRRSRACFAKEGYSMNVFSVDTYIHNRRFTPDELFIPSVNAFKIWHVVIKEVVGYLAYWVVGYV